MTDRDRSFPGSRGSRRRRRQHDGQHGDSAGEGTDDDDDDDGPITPPPPPRSSSRRAQQRRSIQATSSNHHHPHRSIVQHDRHHAQYAMQRRAVLRNGDEYYWWDPASAHHQFPDPAFMESGGLLDWLGRMFWRLVKFLFLLGLSTISYAVFYQFAMPLQHSVKELQFDYTGETLKHLRIEQEQQLHQSQSQSQQQQSDPIFDSAQHKPPIVEESAAPAASQLVVHRPAFLPRRLVYNQREFYDYQQQQQKQLQQQKLVENLPVTPTAVIDLYAKHNDWWAMEPSVLPDTEHHYHPSLSSAHQQFQHRRRLKPQQAYYVEIVLHLPDSSANREAGMFGVVTELYGSSSNNVENGNNNSTTLLAVARRSSRFPHTTPWISTVLKMILLVPILLQALPEARTVTVPVFRQYVEAAEHPLQNVVVKIVQPQQHSQSTTGTTTTGSNAPIVEVIGGELRIGEELSDAQEILKTWFYTCYFVGILTFAFVYYFTGCLWMLLWGRLRQRFTRIKGGVLLDDSNEADMFPDLHLDVDDLDFEDMPFDNGAAFGEQNSHSEYSEAQHDNVDGNAHYQSRNGEETAPSVGHEQNSTVDLGVHATEQHVQSGAINDWGECATDRRENEQATLDEAGEGSSNAVASAHRAERCGNSNTSRRMRAVEIVDEQDGDMWSSSSSWEDLHYPSAETVDDNLVTAKQAALPCANGRVANLDPLRAISDTELVDVLSLGEEDAGDATNGSRVNGSRERHPFFFFLGC